MTTETYEMAKDVPCPYENCGAGVGMECVVHHHDGSAPSIRDSPHVVRVREAKDDDADEHPLVEKLRDEVA
jgi:hypothetical protein